MGTGEPVRMTSRPEPGTRCTECWKLIEDNEWILVQNSPVWIEQYHLACFRGTEMHGKGS